MKTLVAAIILSFLGVTQTAVAMSDISLPLPETEVLPNGLQLVWFLNDRLPVVDISLLVKSGFRDDPLGKTGTSDLLNETLGRGSAGMTAQQMAREIEKLGASRYGSLDDDSFAVGMHGLALDAPVLLGLLSKVALHPDFPVAEVAREQARRLDRWNHLGDSGETLAAVAFNRILSAGTTYGRGSFVSAKEFKSITRDEVSAFHKRHFTPKNSLLMIVGRVDKVTFRQKIIDEFGSWAGEEPNHDWKTFSDPRLPHKGGEIVLVDRPGLTQATVRIGFLAPSIHAPEHYSLSVANALLGEYFNSRLNSIIRDKLGLTYSIESYFSYSKDMSTFDVSCATRNEAVGKLIDKTLEILRQLKETKTPADSAFQGEVQMAKDYLMGGFPLRTSTLGAVASRWLGGYLLNLGPNFLNEFVPKVRMVTPESVIEAVAKDMDLKNPVVVIAGDRKEIEKSFTPATLKKLKRVTIQDLM